MLLLPSTHSIPSRFACLGVLHPSPPCPVSLFEYCIMLLHLCARLTHAMSMRRVTSCPLSSSVIITSPSISDITMLRNPHIITISLYGNSIHIPSLLLLYLQHSFSHPLASYPFFLLTIFFVFFHVIFSLFTKSVQAGKLL